MEKESVRLFEGLKWRGNIYKALILRLMLVMALFSLSRIAFLAFNSSFFPGITLKGLAELLRGGLVFDIATVLYINLLYIFLFAVPFNFRFNIRYQTILKYWFFITNGIALAVNIADFIYYRFTLRRTTADLFHQFENETNLGRLALGFLIDYWYASVFWVLVMILLVYLYKRIVIIGPQLKRPIVYYLSGVLAMPIIAYLIIGGMRGGFRHSTRPITLSNAGEYVKDPREISIVLNTPFSIIRTLGKTKVQRVNYYSDNYADEIYSPIQTKKDSSAFKADNVVIIILESFSKEFFGIFNKQQENGNYTGYTPFLDSLVQFSKTFEYSFANGRKSIDGLPSVIASIPSLGVPYFLSPYSANRINSLATCLKPKGYHTSFFHGAPNGSMGFQAFANIAGIDNYYGMSEYNNDEDFDGMWGIWDDKFLEFYADKLNTFKEPFLSSFFSVSSHHPFKVPEMYEQNFKGGPLVIHKCIQFTDYSLKKFFKKVEKMPWYKNTLFVITADHTSSEIQFDEGRTAWGVYSIPIIFFKPDHSLIGRELSIAQQIDIMPTVLSYLHYDGSFVSFGRDLFSQESKPFAFNYKDNVYQLFEDDYLLQFDGSKSVALYNFKQDGLLTQNKVEVSKTIVSAMEKKIKAIIQQYNNRMIDDKLTVEQE